MPSCILNSNFDFDFPTIRPITKVGKSSTSSQKILILAGRFSENISPSGDFLTLSMVKKCSFREMSRRVQLHRRRAADGNGGSVDRTRSRAEQHKSSKRDIAWSLLCFPLACLPDCLTPSNHLPRSKHLLVEDGHQQDGLIYLSGSVR